MSTIYGILIKVFSLFFLNYRYSKRLYLNLQGKVRSLEDHASLINRFSGLTTCFRRELIIRGSYRS